MELEKLSFRKIHVLYLAAQEMTEDFSHFEGIHTVSPL